MNLIIFSIIVALVNAACEPDYYWRDFKNGIVPKDAFLAQGDENGNQVYIGQVNEFDKEKRVCAMVIGAIYPGTNSMVVSFAGKAILHEKNIKILCTQDPDKFSWKSPNDLDNERTPYDVYVQGGYHYGGTLYIGKANIDEKNVFGEVVFSNDGRYKTLYYASEGVQKQTYDFKILTYNTL